MITIGVDIEQFVADPYGSGIQRVLQYLAQEWPEDVAVGRFVIPREDEFLILSPTQAAELIGIAFSPNRSEHLRTDVDARINALLPEVDVVTRAELPSRIDAWLLPEVSYLPSVLSRFEAMSSLMPTAMIGYDALPMTEPANYRFPPGVAANASEYFRLLASTSVLVCISEYSRRTIADRLRRSPHLHTSVAHPGGDHVHVGEPRIPRSNEPVHFLRVGTMEARKSPLEIVRAFLQARGAGSDVRLTYVGARSSSYEWMNEELMAAEGRDLGFTWLTRASDDDLVSIMGECDAFLSFGTEGYGIPVLESIRRGTPVLFGGIQPAAELVQGLGAVDCGEPSQENIRAMFEKYADRSVIEEARRMVDPQAVPTWADFARGVVQPIVTAL